MCPSFFKTLLTGIIHFLKFFQVKKIFCNDSISPLDLNKGPFPFCIFTKTLFDKINTKIAAGGLKNRAGEEIKEKIDSGLIREDKQYVYPIRQDIPIMLVDEAIPFEQFTWQDVLWNEFNCVHWRIDRLQLYMFAANQNLSSTSSVKAAKR